MSQSGAQNLAHGHAIIGKYLLAVLFPLAPAGSDQAMEKKKFISLSRKDLIPIERPWGTDWHGGLWHNIRLFGSFFRPDTSFRSLHPSAKST